MIGGRQRRETTPDGRDVRHVSDAYFSVDGGWRFTDCNDRAARLLGRPREQLLGRVIWDEFPETRETAFPEQFHRAVEAGEPRSFEVHHRPRDTTLAVDVYPTGEGLAATMEEAGVGERPAGDGRTRSAMVDAADVPMFALDDGGRFVDANPALCSLAGIDRGTLLGGHVSTLLESATDEVALRQARGESGGGAEVTVETAEGDRRQCVATVAPTPSDDGGLVAVLRDVTPRRGREQRLAVLDRVLRHNLRNELNVALASAEAIRAATDDEAVAADARRVAESARELIDLSEGVRRFADALDPELGEARVHDAAERVEAAVDRVRSAHPGADVRLVLRDDPAVRVHESALIAIEELIENAAEHGATVPADGADAVAGDATHPRQRADATGDGATPSHGGDGATDGPGDALVRVTVSATGDPGDGRVAVEVADRGPGLPENERAVLTAGEETPLEHASGLGLWLVNWGVRKSGGELEFSERDPWGSVVTVRLPRADPDDPTAGSR